MFAHRLIKKEIFLSKDFCLNFLVRDCFVTFIFAVKIKIKMFLFVLFSLFSLGTSLSNFKHGTASPKPTSKSGVPTVQTVVISVVTAELIIFLVVLINCIRPPTNKSEGEQMRPTISVGLLDKQVI